MLDRTIAPESYPVDKFRLPEYQEHITPSGISIFSVTDSQLPILQIEFLFEGGKAKQSIPGTSYYAIKMLAEGSSTKTAQQISFGFESLGSFVEFGSGIDHAFVKVYCQSSRALETLDLLEEVLNNPVFPEDNFEVLKQIRTQQVKQQQAKNSQVATARFNQMLFGSDHPVGSILTTEEAMNCKLSHVQNFYEKQLFNKPQVFITGHVTADVLQHLQGLISSLSTTAEQQPTVSPQSKYVFDSSEIKDSQQVSFRMGMFSIGKNHPDIHKLSIANTLYGGFFGSRLMQKVREELGYTYGIYSSFVHTLSQSYWLISSELIKEHADHGIEAIHKELVTLASQPPSEAELNKLKNYLKGKLLSSMDSIFSQGNIIKGLKIFKLTDSYYDEYFRAIDSIQPSEISEIITEYCLKPEKASLRFG